MTAPSIHLEGLCKVYPGAGTPVTALSDVSISIRNGERVGIIGENGAGKSTLLQIVAGVNEATAGRVDISGNVHAALTVGMGVREEATGRENLYLDGEVQGKTRDQIDAHIEEMIAFAELGEFIDRPMRTYSSGMKARLAFASLVFVDPEILIIDEALSVGDAHFNRKASAVVRRLCDRGKIVIVVSHSMMAIRELCNRCIWLDQGRLRADGSPEEVTAAYREMINAREAADIERKFGVTGRSWSRDENVGVYDLRLVSGHDELPTVVVQEGTAADLLFTFKGTQPLRSPKVRLWVERNDGLLLLDETLEIKREELKRGHQSMRLRLGTIDWRPFMYQLHVELLDGEATLAHSAISLKVIEENAIFGGEPVLRRAPLIRGQALP